MKKRALFECQECGRKFYSVAAAEKAMFGDTGCPGCGGSDIDESSDRGLDPVEFTETEAGYRGRERWARSYDELNGAPESERDR